jgi:uncharacterized protein DUF5049
VQYLCAKRDTSSPSTGALKKRYSLPPSSFSPLAHR